MINRGSMILKSGDSDENKTKPRYFLFTAQPCCSAWRLGSLVSVFWNAPMLRDTARRFLLLYLVVDVIINPVDIASGKSTRCSEISFLGLNLPTTCYHGSINNLKASKVLLKFEYTYACGLRMHMGSIAAPLLSQFC